jgi:hypothetical protein
MKTSRHKTIIYMEGLVKQLERTETQAITKRASLDMLGQQGRKVNMYAGSLDLCTRSSFKDIIST